MAQQAVYTCQIFGKETVKLKEADIPKPLLEQFSSALQHEKHVRKFVSVFLGVFVPSSIKLILMNNIPH